MCSCAKNPGPQDSGKTDSRLSSAVHKYVPLGKALVVGKQTNQKISNEGAWTNPSPPPPVLYPCPSPVEGTCVPTSQFFRHVQ